MATRTLVIEIETDSVIERALKAVQEELGFEDPAVAMVNGMVKYAFEHKLLPSQQQR